MEERRCRFEERGVHAERLLARCDAVLRVGGASQGADLMVEVARRNGLRVFHRLREVPGCALMDKGYLSEANLATFRAQGVFRRLARSAEPVFVPAARGTKARLVIPVRAGGEWLGSIWAVVEERPPAALVGELVQTSSVVALHLLRLRAQADLSRRVAADLSAAGWRLERVLSDNGSCYRSRQFRAACLQLGIQHRFTRPYTPRTNGKAERFIQTALREWAYVRHYLNSEERDRQLSPWLEHYNFHRPHGSLGYAPPISRAPVGTTS